MPNGRRPENRSPRKRHGTYCPERPDGMLVPFMPYPTPLHDASGKVIGAVNGACRLISRTAHRRSRRGKCSPLW